MVNKLIIVYLVSLATSACLGLAVIPLLKRFKAGQNILCYLKEHLSKSGTPTMGGLFFVPSVAVAYFVFCRKENSIARLCMLICLAYAIVGFLDDFIKIKFCRNEGLTARQKLFFQIGVAILSSVFAHRMGLTKLYIPFTRIIIDIGIWFVPLSIFVFLATTNCVNLTDGLDGLAGTVGSFAFISSTVLIMLEIALFNVYVQKSQYENLAMLSLAMAGALSGFLIFNTYKASVFMGDTGSLAIGGLFASVMIYSGNTLFIPIIGIMFVVSGISVIMQVSSFKMFGKRIFAIAPLHHHFQQKGKTESKIVFGYGTITLIMGAVCIITLLR